MKISETEVHKYERDVDLEGDSTYARVLRMVKRNTKVLDIGAGPGTITKHLSNTLGCDVVALEIDAESINKLKNYTRKIYDYDLNDPSWSEKIRAAESCFDFVIATDVLEHVYDPWTVLAGMKSLVSETGSIIVSLPHAAHACVLGCLIDEDFEYRENGLLDRTHIRFFGMKNIQELFEKNDLSIEQYELITQPPLKTEFADRWNKLPLDIRAMLQQHKFSHVYQVICRAVPRGRLLNNLNIIENSEKVENLICHPSPHSTKNMADSFSYQILKNEFDILRQELDRTRKSLNEILSSKSWKITYPIRRLTGLIKNIL